MDKSYFFNNLSRSLLEALKGVSRRWAATAYAELEDDQARQIINTEQVFDAYRSAQTTLRDHFTGSMAWKTVDGRSYLYRARNGIWVSLGPRSPETEAIRERFIKGRIRARLRKLGLAQRLNKMAPVNRAHRLGRVPVIAARILRALAEARLTRPVIATVGTNALYAYERMAGVRSRSPVRCERQPEARCPRSRGGRRRGPAAQGRSLVRDPGKGRILCGEPRRLHRRPHHPGEGSNPAERTAARRIRLR